MALFELVLLILLGSVAGSLFYNAAQQRQQQRQIDNAFYQLLESQNSCISLIQLTAAARIEPQIAKQFLEEKANVFGAIPEVDAEGNTFYRFPQMRFSASSERED